MTKRIDDDALSNVSGGGGSPGGQNEDIQLNTPDDADDPTQEKEEAQDGDNHGVNFRD